MNSIVLELQSNCIAQDLKLTDLLRKAYLIATKLDLKESQVWIKKELDGYTNQCDIPSYRQTFCELKAYNPHRGWIPVIIADHDFEALVCNVNIIQPISEIEKLIEIGKDSGTLQIPLSGQQLTDLQQMLKCGYNINRFISATTMDKVTDSVRTVILEWAVSLEKQGILGENLLFTNEERSKALGNQVININNSNIQGILGTVANSNVEQNLSFSIRKGNKEDLTKALIKHKIETSDIDQLIDVIDIDTPINNVNFGSQVSNWIGTMAGKAVSGVWKITSDLAVGVLTKAISQYYGF